MMVSNYFFSFSILQVSRVDYTPRKEEMVGKKPRVNNYSARSLQRREKKVGTTTTGIRSAGSLRTEQRNTQHAFQIIGLFTKHIQLHRVRVLFCLQPLKPFIKKYYVRTGRGALEIKRGWRKSPLKKFNGDTFLICGRK